MNRDYTKRDIKKILKENNFTESKREKNIVGEWEITKPGFVIRDINERRTKIIRIEIFQSQSTDYLTWISQETRELYNKIFKVLDDAGYDLDPGQWGNSMIIHINKEKLFK